MESPQLSSSGYKVVMGRGNSLSQNIVLRSCPSLFVTEVEVTVVVDDDQWTFVPFEGYRHHNVDIEEFCCDRRVLVCGL
jgi:hypothetical protein